MRRPGSGVILAPSRAWLRQRSTSAQWSSSSVAANKAANPLGGYIPAMSDAPASLANTLSDRYTIERLLGHGGMATVHLAEEKKHKRKVAIKILKQEFGASVGAERFLREIGIAAQLSHPHIVPLIDSGESDGALWYVSPYIAGGSLRDRLDREKKLSIDDALRI